MGQDVSACWLVDGAGQLIAQRLSQTQRQSGPGLRSHLFRRVSLNPWLFFFFEGETLKGVERDRQTEVRTFLLAAVFVPWLATPSSMASLRPRAEQDSDPPTPAAIAACYTDPVQTRSIALHEPRTAIVPCSAGLLLKQVHDRWTEAPQQATVRGGLCITPVVFIVVPLLLLLLPPPPPPLLSLLFLYSSPFPSCVEYIQYFMLALSSGRAKFWVELMSFPSKLVTTPVSYTSASSILLLHAQGGKRGYLYSHSWRIHSCSQKDD